VHWLALVLLAILIQTTGDGDGGSWGYLLPPLLLAVVVLLAAATMPRVASVTFAQPEISRAEKAVLVGKSAAAWFTGWFYGYSRGDRTLMIGLTLPQAAATLAVTVTASEVGAFDKVVVDAVVVVIFVSCLVGPALSRFAGRKLVRDQ